MALRKSNAERADEFHGDVELQAAEKAVRRIVRGSDLRSRALARTTGLTAPQLAVLKAAAALGEVTTTALSAHVDLSPATVVTVLDNLEARGLAQRHRSRHDRRVVHARPTARGRALVRGAPEPLGTDFAARFQTLEPGRRRELIAALNEFADLLAPGAAAAPDTGPPDGGRR